MHDHIAKPINPADLIEKVAAWMERSKAANKAQAALADSKAAPTSA